MNFATVTRIIEKIYSFLEKFELQNIVDLDNLLDNNYPEFACRLPAYIENEKIIFSSTNGKRTSLDLFNQVLKTDGKSFITNLSKTAAIRPVLTSIILNIAKEANFAKSNYLTAACLDSELTRSFNLLNFDYLVLNNLFSSPTDTSALHEKRKKIKDAIILNSKLNLVINADEVMFFEIDNIKNGTIKGKKRKQVLFWF